MLCAEFDGNLLKKFKVIAKNTFGLLFCGHGVFALRNDAQRQWLQQANGHKNTVCVFVSEFVSLS